MASTVFTYIWWNREPNVGTFALDFRRVWQLLNPPQLDQLGLSCWFGGSFEPRRCMIVNIVNIQDLETLRRKACWHTCVHCLEWDNWSGKTYLTVGVQRHCMGWGGVSDRIERRQWAEHLCYLLPVCNQLPPTTAARSSSPAARPSPPQWNGAHPEGKLLLS